MMMLTGAWATAKRVLATEGVSGFYGGVQSMMVGQAVIKVSSVPKTEPGNGKLKNRKTRKTKNKTRQLCPLEVVRSLTVRGFYGGVQSMVVCQAVIKVSSHPRTKPETEKPESNKKMKTETRVSASKDLMEWRSVRWGYRGTSPIRKRPPPYDPPLTLGIGLR